MRIANDAVEPKVTTAESQPRRCIAFIGHRCVAAGPMAEVADALRDAAAPELRDSVLVFDEATGEVLDVDPRARMIVALRCGVRSEQESEPKAEGVGSRGPGRPRLGVIPREVTLLPGQWEWLDTQPGGASAALRRLVHEAKRASPGKDRARQAQEAVYRFMTAMAGDFPGFEEALRAFYRRDEEKFRGLVQSWPKDIRDQVNRFVAAAQEAQAQVTAAGLKASGR